MAQYLQLVSNTAASTPLDVYALATNNIKPLVADQVSLGYFHNFLNNTIETSVETYYKSLNNQMDYIDNADLFLNEELESQLLMAKGRAYGVELFVRKKSGKWTGWISYTYSKTQRLTPGISNNQWYNSKYDRPHVINFVNNYELNKRWSFSCNFVFLSGTPSTFPDVRLQIQGYSIPYNTTNLRNNYRIPAYHRLDLGATYQFRKNDVKRYKQNLVFSIYNVYARRNAYTVYFTNREGFNQAIRFSVIATVVPSITYNFTF
jgi:outer membrane cobalamin receptor